MKRTMFKSKIHRATVTHADLTYEGSVTIDETLMRAADILPYEKVAIWDATNGARIETYALPGEADSGIVCVNGAAARLVQPGDVVILATFAEGVDEAEAKTWKPTVVRVDGSNHILSAAPQGEDPWPGTPLGDVLSGNSKNPRLEMLRSFAAKQPNDRFPRYALAMELKTSGDGEGAWREFESLIADHADYIATYAPAGEVLTRLGRVAEARVLYGKGIEVCSRRNDGHTRDHLEAALDALGLDN